MNEINLNILKLLHNDKIGERKEKFLKCLLKITGKDADTKSANKNRHPKWCLFLFANDFINALSIQLCTRRDVVVCHEQVQLSMFIFIFLLANRIIVDAKRNHIPQTMHIIKNKQHRKQNCAQWRNDIGVFVGTEKEMLTQATSRVQTLG